VLVTVAMIPPYSGRELDEATRPLWPHSVGAYRNFKSRPGDEAFDRTFPGAAGERVESLTAGYDPDGVLSRFDRL
jgi:hypothetical protein